ncbi:MAG: hypothetical protein QOA70_06775 [Nitrososphaeraceae archaeon]|nr:hypothetical protein [Nitrososphaeraceae archaeon]
MPNASKANIEKFYGPLVSAMAKYEINNKYRVAAFLATIAHESGELRYVEELASGEAYDTRTDLGNTPEKDGDGIKYKGRGLIQITGKENYRLLSLALSYDFINKPEDLEMPGAASMSAAWFWRQNFLNRLADIEAFQKIQIRVNGINRVTGKPNGWEDRLKHYERIKKALGMAI